MTLRERASLATAVRQHRARQRAVKLRRFIEAGECMKRAAHAAGVSYRTARRYRARGLA